MQLNELSTPQLRLFQIQLRKLDRFCERIIASRGEQDLEEDEIDVSALVESDLFKGDPHSFSLLH